MEKLIELLLECKPQTHYLDKPKGVYDKRYGIGWYKREGDIGGWFSVEVIISKKFGFIKWLVENDKIDTKKVVERREEDGWSIVNYNHYEEMMTRNVRVKYWVDNTLMALSTSDTPIEDLISYLK